METVDILGAASHPDTEPLACVSCRARKLKCDRIKPVCSRCVRADNECVYPESRRKPTFKRRNVRELEARLGMPLEVELESPRRFTYPSSQHRLRATSGSPQRISKTRTRLRHLVPHQGTPSLRTSTMTLQLKSPTNLVRHKTKREFPGKFQISAPDLALTMPLGTPNSWALA